METFVLYTTEEVTYDASEQHEYTPVDVTIMILCGNDWNVTQSCLQSVYQSIQHAQTLRPQLTYEVQLLLYQTKTCQSIRVGLPRHSRRFRVYPHETVWTAIRRGVHDARGQFVLVIHDEYQCGLTRIIHQYTYLVDHTDTLVYGGERWGGHGWNDSCYDYIPHDPRQVSVSTIGFHRHLVEYHQIPTAPRYGIPEPVVWKSMDKDIVSWTV